MQSRRDFLRLLGLAVGTSLAAGCGSSGSGSGTFSGFSPVANSYRFVPLITSGGTLPNRSLVLAQASDDRLPFLGPVAVNDLRHISFQALDQSDLLGTYRVDYEANGAISQVKAVIKEGDVLPDGSVVDDISPGCLNNSDDCAFVVRDTQGLQSLQYSEGGEAFEKLLTPYDDVNSEVRLYGDLHPELAVSDNSDILFSCNYREADGYCKGEGLFYVPRKNKSQARLLLSEDELLPGIDASVSSFGVFDIANDETYLVHGAAAPLAGQTEDGVSLTYLLKGRVGETPEVLVAHPALGGQDIAQGTVYLAPRLGSGGGYGAVVHTSADNSSLYLNNKSVLSAEFESGGVLSPRGNRIVSFFPPVFGPNGMVLVQVFTDAGSELLVSNGQSFYTAIAVGDEVAGKVVTDLMFGVLPHCVNAHGEFALVAYFLDKTSSILLGIPV